MAISIGNRTSSNLNPAASTQTLTHTQDVGSDGVLLVAINMANTVNINSVTYNGVAMTQRVNYSSGGLSQRWAYYELASPATGSNNVVVTFSANQFNSTSLTAQSFLGANTGGATGNNDQATTPHSRNLTIATNSIIYLMGTSPNAQSFGYDINGSTRTNLFSHNTNKIVEAAISATGIGSGSIACVTKADFGNVSNVRIEIPEAGTPPPATSGNFLLMF
jgi:hypothetical protein